MNKEYDFSKTGKRMPYSVPDDFFTELESNLRQELVSQPAKKNKARQTVLRVVFGAVASVAAVVALVFFLHKDVQSSPEARFAEVEQSFGNLSEEDRDYLLAVYQDDLFINE